MNVSKRSKMIAASVAGLLAMGTMTAVAQAEMGAAGVPCYGINKCKSAGDCGGKGYSCAGKNACKQTGFITLAAEACTKIEGGSLTPLAA